MASCQCAVSITRKDLADEDVLWDMMMRCKRGVNWKPSVKAFCLNGSDECIAMADKIMSGKWKNGRPKNIVITYPKKREGLSIRFPDRVYQRGINDLVLYPEMTRHFIYANCACQKGKGPDVARKIVLDYLRNFLSRHGLNGYLLQIDITGYYPNMRHDDVKKCFRKYIKTDVAQMIEDVLDQQYVGSVGYNPGSQMVQIAGISLLNNVDHYIKERLGCRYYIRYMDDFWILCEDYQRLLFVQSEIESKLSDYGFKTSQKKTHITELKKGFRFLGFGYHIEESGHIWMTVDPASVKHERKKLRRLVVKSVKGDISPYKPDECLNSWKAHAEHGKSYQLFERLDEYYQNLWKEAYSAREENCS